MDAYVGEIRIFAGNFAPVNWSFCDGQLLAIQDNQALFALIGTTYGGNGSTTFGKPDLRGRLPIGDQQGTGLSNRVMGQPIGTETVTLTETQLPAHQHQVTVSTTAANLSNVTANLIGGGLHYVSATETSFTEGAMEAGTIGATGGNAAHNNMMPYLVLNFIICLNGIFPSRN